MSTAESVTAESASVEAHDGHEHEHSDKRYVMVFIALFIITAVEVAWLYMGLPTWALVGGLFAMMAIKFFLICGEFMHLKIDIRLFTQLFVGGLILATLVYVAMLSATQFWDTF